MPNTDPAAAASKAHEINVMLFAQADYTAFQLVPGAFGSSWCSLLPGESEPVLGEVNDNFIGWFSSEHEAIDTVVEEYIRPTVEQVHRLDGEAWPGLTHAMQLQFVENAALGGFFKQQGAAVSNPT